LSSQSQRGRFAADLPTTSPTPRGATLVVLAALTVFATLSWLSRTAGITHSNDDALYALLGDQLTHLSYRETWKVGAPMHGQYPPLWPAMLGLVQLVSGGSVPAQFALVTLTMTTALGVFYDICRRLFSPWLAAAVLTTAALNPFTITSAGRLMSEAAFLLWSMLTLWALLRARGTTHPARWLLFAAGASLAAALTRSIGVTLIGGVLASWLVERRWKAFVLFSLFCLTVVGGWFAWTIAHNEGVAGRSYVEDAVSITKDRSLVKGRRSVLVEVATRVARRGGVLLVDHIPSGMPFPTKSGTKVDNALWLIFTVIAGLAGALALLRWLPAGTLYVVFYLGLLLVWPWAPRRFFIPLQPLVLLTLVVGVHALAQRRPRWRGAATPLILAFLLLVTAAALPASIAIAREGLRCDRDDPWTSDGCYTEDQQAFFKAVAFARDSLPTTARFLVEREAAFAFHTRRVVEHAQAPLTLPDSQFRAHLREVKIEYVVLSRLTSKEVWELLPKLVTNCEYLSTLRVFAPTARIYLLHETPLPDAENACADVRRGIGPSPT